MRQELNSSRREQVMTLRKTGLTYAAIARKLGMTRERARQITTGVSLAKKKLTRNDPDTLLTTAEVAGLLNIHVNTVRRWSNRGILETYCVGPRGDRRFKRRHVNQLLRRKSSASSS